MSSPGSGYRLFGQRQFRNLFSANLIVNLSLVMLMLGVSWAMTSLTASPVLISLVQTVLGLPFLLIGIPVAIAADTRGYRTVLLASQLWLLAVVALMGVIAVVGGWEFTPLLLLSMTFLVGIGIVLQQSAWKPFLQDQVPKHALMEAISFNSLSTDFGRAVGPVIGGYLMGFFGTAVVLFTSALSQLVMILTVKAVPGRAERRSETAAPSLRQGWSAVRRSPRLHGPMIRCVLLLAPAGGLLGLLPLEAKENIQTGPIGYGGLLAALGIGTAAAGALTPVLRRHVRFNRLATVAVVGVAAAVLAVSRWDSMLLDAAFLICAGFFWSVLSIAHQFAVQVAAPEDMRGLMNSFYGLVVQGSMVLGSVLFGLLAQWTGVSASIFIAGWVALSAVLLVGRYPIPDSST